MGYAMKKKVNFFRVLLFVCVLGYTVWVFIAQQIDINQNNKKLADLDSKIQSEELRNEELKNEEKQIGSPEYMKKLARERNGMIMSDEILYVDALKGD